MVILMWTSLNKKLYLFMGIILLIGIIAGVFFVLMLDEASKEVMFLNINEMIQNFGNIKINNIVSHLLILSSLLILTIMLVGAPLVIFFIFYNGFSIGFIISSLTSIFGIKGLIYGIIYVILTKGLFLLFLFIFSITLFKIIKNIIDKVFYKKHSNMLTVLGEKALVCIILIVISDIIIYFGGSKLVNVFNFLLN